MNRAQKVWATGWIVLAAAGVAWAAGPGDLDPAYGDQGILFTGGTESDGKLARAHAVDPATGSAVVAGRHGRSTGTYVVDGSTRHVFPGFVRRYTPAGSADAAFGAGGEVTLFSTYGGHVWTVAVDGQGRTLVGGDATYLVTSGSGRKATTSEKVQAVVVRLAADGSPDASFGTGGTLALEVPGALASSVKELRVLGDGSLAVAGTVDVASKGKPSVRTRPFAARFAASGSPLSFGDAGYAVDTRVDGLRAAGDDLNGLGVQPSGAVVLGFEGGAGWTLTRFTSAGQPDTTFGVRTRPAGTLRGMTVMSDGRILACGSGIVGTDTPSILVARYDTAGSADAFGTGGEVELAAAAAQSAAGAPEVTPAGAILVATWSRPAAASAAEVAPLRLNADGSPDTTFGPGGFGDSLLLGLDPYATWAAGISRMPDGGVLLRGEAREYDGTYYTDASFLARYLP